MQPRDTIKKRKVELLRNYQEHNTDLADAGKIGYCVPDLRRKLCFPHLHSPARQYS